MLQLSMKNIQFLMAVYLLVTQPPSPPPIDIKSQVANVSCERDVAQKWQHGNYDRYQFEGISSLETD